ncbi:MAG: TetR/AcrR family transcriptional regulator [Caulobacteraceae bacterium]
MAALRVIMRAGVGGLTIREVAKEAGFTTGALTHYFTSKDQVLIEASEYSAKMVRPRMERAGRDKSALAGLRKIIGESLPINPVTRGYWRVWVGFWERASYNTDVARVMRARYDEWRGRLAGAIRRAQSEGEAVAGFDPDLAAQELVALVDGIGVQVLLRSGRIPVARQWRIIDSWIEGMVAGHAGRPLGNGVHDH